MFSDGKAAGMELRPKDGKKVGIEQHYVPNAPLGRASTGKLRVIVMRNGESTDRLTKDWMRKVFTNSGVNLIDINQTVRLPSRDPAYFKNDAPLTYVSRGGGERTGDPQVGYMCAFLVGTHLRRMKLKLTAMFSSPSLRCVQSCSAFLDAFEGKEPPPVFVEPGFFEPLLFYEKVDGV